IDSSNSEISLNGVPAGLYEVAILPDGQSGSMNYSLKIVAPAAARPNLVADTLSNPADNPSLKSFPVSARLRNVGGAAAGPFQVQYFVSTDAQLEPVKNPFVSSVFSVPGLAASADSTDTRSLDLSLLKSGSCFLGVVIDPAHQVNEESQRDNVALVRLDVLPP